jgi:hypothetical protein
MAGAETGAGHLEVPYERAAKVRPDERDYKLAINKRQWPPDPPDGWERTRYGLWREIARVDAVDAKQSPVPAELEELILRFPSAPVHGFQRLHEHHMELGPSENFHTYRVLRSADSKVVAEPISRIFLMHTGLNERNTMGLYYRLASQLISQEPTTVCIVRPFPGHLTRYPFQAFAETPLDLYLWDGSHLFRQFMRYMVETQWFLSAIVRRSSYRCASGADLLEESEKIEESRLDPRRLAKAIKRDWDRLHRASAKTAQSERAAIEAEEAKWGVNHQRRPPVNQEGVYQQQILNAIRGLRDTLNLDRDFAKRDGSLGGFEGPEEPSIHVLGYSLGGFTAQSVFMSWPFVVSSCSTMLAGGALRELAPTGFADPEEWQTVLHSLRYELDDRMMSTHLGATDDVVGGLDRDLFTYFKRTFYEVFQQEYRGSIQTRYKAFGDRMFFIVGGDDPVMRPESVLQSSPKGGLNLLEVGGLGHFLQDATSGASGEQQRTFWLPEMSTLIHRFSNNAADQHRAQLPLTWFDKDMRRPDLTRTEWQTHAEGEREKGRKPGAEVPASDEPGSPVQPLAPAELIAIENDGALPGEIFERCLDDLLYRVSEEGDGVLFILRNEVPTAFLPPEAIRETAAALYHDDLNIARYCHGTGARQSVLKNSIGRICLVLPWNARSIMSRMDAQRAFPGQAESAGGRVKQCLTSEQLWRRSLNQCFALADRRGGSESIRKFNGNDSRDFLRSVTEKTNHRLARLVPWMGDYTRTDAIEAVPSLPDGWIWASSKALSLGQGMEMRDGIEGLLNFVFNHCASDDDMLKQIRDDQVRIVNVSRARYNPRFRGRLLVNGSEARKRILHAALCVGISDSIHGQDPDTVFT